MQLVRCKRRKLRPSRVKSSAVEPRLGRPRATESVMNEYSFSQALSIYCPMPIKDRAVFSQLPLPDKNRAFEHRGRTHHHTLPATQRGSFQCMRGRFGFGRYSESAHASSMDRMKSVFALMCSALFRCGIVQPIPFLRVEWATASERE